MSLSHRMGELGRNLLAPFWRYAPLWLRRRLIWLGSAKFLVGVSAVCVNPANQMLVLRHRFHNEHPWGLPGGWADSGETPVESILREIREETGLDAVVEGLLSVEGDGEWVEIIYLCRVPDGEPVIQKSEALEYRWVTPTDHALHLNPMQAKAAHLAATRLVNPGSRASSVSPEYE